jgi:hypothetical protein
MALRLSYHPLFVFSLGCLLVAGVTVTALAAECGDDVGGTRVACSCGDIVVSDTKLRSEDSVSRHRCRHDGLVLRARRGAESIELDLAGLSIVGSGSGSGIRILDGGENGAVIIGGEPGRSGEIAGFRTGVRATGSHPVAEIRDLTIKGSSRDGLVLRGAAARLVRVTSDSNGGDGLRIGGRQHTLEAVEASGNGRYGVRVTARGAEGVVATADNTRGAILPPARGSAVNVQDKP